MRWLKALGLILIARFGRSYGSLDYLGWPAFIDEIVASLANAD